MRFDTVRFAGLVAVLFLGSSCSGDGGTAAGGSPVSTAGGSGNGGAAQSSGAATSSGGRIQGSGGLPPGTGNRPASNGGRAGASGNGGLSGAMNTGGTLTDASVGGTSSDGGNPGSGGAGGASSSGGTPTDASGNLCGTEPCSSTRCAGWNCGPAVCCVRQSQPICVHGTTTCPNPDGGGDSATLQCWGGAKSAYVFEKSCTQKSDCFVAQHWVGCCNVHAVGLNTSEQSRFDSFETSCGGAPPCGCCCDRVTAEDGTVVASGTTLGVDCVAGLCKSTAP